MRMIVSVTERQTFKRCRRKWLFGSPNGLNLQPAATVSKALDLGSLVHKSLADWILEPKAQLPRLFMHHSAIKLDQLNKHYLEVVGTKASDAEVEPLLEVVELGRKMMTNYQLFHKTPLPAHMSFVAPEQEIHIPIPGTEHTCLKCNSTGEVQVNLPGIYIPRAQCDKCGGTGILYHILRGTLDALVQDTKDRLHVLEHKTYGRRPKESTLAGNDQFLAYIWVLTQLNIGPVAGIAYDGMWKKAVPTRKGSMADLFLRTELHRPKAELEEFGRLLADEVNEMANPSTPIYINRRWEGCDDCPFGQLCTATSLGEDTDYIIKNFYQKRDRDDPMGVAEVEPELAEVEPY